MKFIDLNKNLKQKIAHTYSIVGNDFFLIKQSISILKSHLIHEAEDFNYIKLDAEKLKYVGKDTLLIDLASNPGGIDKEEAKNQGIKLIHALGLPGKVAPKSSAKFIKDIVYEII